MKIKDQSFHEFSNVHLEHWVQEVERTLKGKSIQSLEKETYEGIFLKPLYSLEDIQSLVHVEELPGAPSYVRGTKASGYLQKGWEIAQEMNLPDTKRCNELLRSSLDRGQTMVALQLDTATANYIDADVADHQDIGDGVSISHLQDIEELFQGISLEEYPLFINTHFTSLPFLSLLTSYCEKHDIQVSSLTGTIGMDPLGSMIQVGTSPIKREKMYDHMTDMTKWASSEENKLRTILVNSHPYHNGGANAVQELAYVLATVVEYTDECLKRGLPLQTVLNHMTISFSISSNLFMEVAKLRAFKVLWTNAVRAFQKDECVIPPFIHAKTALTTKTKYDAHTNILRGTVEAFAAVVGGVDALHVSPYDTLLQPCSEFSNRIARNTQLILQKEVHLTKVIDPVGGSWYVESLTQELAEKAWELFLDIEKQGGMYASLKEGFIQSSIQQTVEKRKKKVSTRTDRVVGVTHYANLQEKQMDYEQGFSSQRAATLRQYHQDHVVHINETDTATLTAYKELFLKGATLGDVMSHIKLHSEREEITSIVPWRKSESFEQLRHRVEQANNHVDTPLTVGVVLLSTERLAKQRVEFVQSFFQSGSIQTQVSPLLYSAHEIVNWIKQCKYDAYVLCGTAENYEEVVLDALHFLNHKEELVYISGNVTEGEKQLYVQAGLKDTMTEQDDAVLFMHTLLNQLGVQ
ncbi:methylmalonyl-CoA mutase family protein [Bacillus sp. CGMCC 1.16541]|uniref:methylmalonyl-CoA mutase family protein n=1 Tax=Bacillus sp. CGMCC 1.16541 TaxID=2185143 RepID=UPI000D7353C2|nr:methylmalonyl-CoA mutase family protein [Bacillus sp. CGMCC 1.16541]